MLCTAEAISSVANNCQRQSLHIAIIIPRAFDANGVVTMLPPVSTLVFVYLTFDFCGKDQSWAPASWVWRRIALFTLWYTSKLDMWTQLSWPHFSFPVFHFTIDLLPQPKAFATSEITCRRLTRAAAGSRPQPQPEALNSTFILDAFFPPNL